MTISYPFGANVLTEVYTGINPNDGKGWDLRTSFITTNDNMANIAGWYVNPTLPDLSITPGNLYIDGTRVSGDGSTIYINGSPILTNANVTFNGGVVTGDTIFNANVVIGDVVSWYQTITTNSTSPNIVLVSVPTITYRSVTFTIQAVDAITPRYHTAIIQAIHNNTGTAVSTEYGGIDIGGQAASFTANVDITGTYLQLLATPVLSYPTVFKILVTAVKV